MAGLNIKVCHDVEWQIPSLNWDQWSHGFIRAGVGGLFWDRIKYYLLNHLTELLAEKIMNFTWIYV